MYNNLFNTIISHNKYNPYSLEKKLRGSKWNKTDFNYCGVSLNWINSSLFLDWLYKNKDFKEYYKVNNKRSKQNRRVKNRICDIYFNDDFSYFITLTFNDKSLELKESTRHKYVLNFLKKYCVRYIANIDYGSENGREHYHAVGSILTDLDNVVWKYGFIYIEEIRKATDDIKLAQYMNKLTNHALKEHGKRKHLIYSH